MDEVDQVMVAVRADTGAFARDVEAMRRSLEGPLGAGADRAGRAIETSLLRAVRTGKLGFEDLKKAALDAMTSIAAAALRAGVAEVIGGGGGGGAGPGAGLAAALAGIVAGAPGRATGGPVSPGRAYRVGERGPELFVPTASGRVEPAGAAAAPREVRVAITVNAGGDAAGALLQQSSRQVARAVRAALEG